MKHVWQIWQCWRCTNFVCQYSDRVSDTRINETRHTCLTIRHHHHHVFCVVRHQPEDCFPAGESYPDTCPGTTPFQLRMLTMLRLNNKTTITAKYNCIHTIVISPSPSLSLMAIFQGEPGLAVLLKLRMMEAVVGCLGFNGTFSTNRLYRAITVG